MTTKLQLQKENTALQRYVDDLKARHDRAIKALANLSQGLGRKNPDHDTNPPSWDVCMRKLASEELADIARMPLRVPS